MTSESIPESPPPPASTSPQGRKRARDESGRVFLSNSDLLSSIGSAAADRWEQEQQQQQQEQYAEQEQQQQDQQLSQGATEHKNDEDDNEPPGPARKRQRRLRRMTDPNPEEEEAQQQQQQETDPEILEAAEEVKDLQQDEAEPELESAINVDDMQEEQEPHESTGLSDEDKHNQEESNMSQETKHDVDDDGEEKRGFVSSAQQQRPRQRSRPVQDSKQRAANARFAEEGDANRAAGFGGGGGGGGLASMLEALAGVGGAAFLDPVRPCALLSIESKDNEIEEKDAEDRYKQYEQALRLSGELQEDDDTIAKDMAALDTVVHGALAAYTMNRRFFDLNIGWKPETWCFMCECGQNREMWEKNRYYGQMIKIIEDGLQTMDPTVLCRKVQMHYNKELRWTLRRKELRDMPWKKVMIWKHITEHAATTRTMLELERINMSSMMNVLTSGGIMTMDPATNRKSIDLNNAKAYLMLAAKRDKVMQQLVLMRPHDTF